MVHLCVLENEMSDDLPESVEAAKRCCKCGGEMEQGFVRDAATGGFLVSHWVKGVPESSFWRGTKSGQLLPIGTFRCSLCGYLESYARIEFATQ